jgi:hypothetical protein
MGSELIIAFKKIAEAKSNPAGLRGGLLLRGSFYFSRVIRLCATNEE